MSDGGPNSPSFSLRDRNIAILGIVLSELQRVPTDALVQAVHEILPEISRYYRFIPGYRWQIFESPTCYGYVSA